MGLNTVTLSGLLYTLKRQSTTGMTWRTPGAPLRPGSLYVQAERADTGTMITGTADVDGVISGTGVEGHVNASTGVVTVHFGEWVDGEDWTEASWYDPSLENEAGQVFRPLPVLADTVKYNCVVYSYLPLDADLIGLDPVRLPQDGRVPVFRKGDIAVVHHTDIDVLPNPLTAGHTATLSRGALSWVDLHDKNGLWVPSAGLYTVDLAAGTMAFADPLPDLAAYEQPFQVRHRREDMVLLGDVSINGTISAVAPLTHDYPADESLVSTVLPIGDLQAGTENEFTQATWTSVWSDSRVGSGTTAQFNLVQYPVEVTNKGAIGERWAVIFTGSDAFNIVGETVGIIATGYTSQDMAPVNPATGVPYFFLDHRGWGTGWSSGNVLRFNTRAAHYPVWVVRTTLQGPETEAEDSFTIQIRGDAN
ncbi:MAG: hypothetical protein EOM25_13955 [Deltaproteobacteria bacterium]|nr:hypothetical protein [Deltaproteobacteria bacterium]